MSCDLLPSEVEGPHHQGDVRELLAPEWDLMIAFPPCTYLARSGALWWAKPGRAESADEAAAFVRELHDAPIPRVAIENPVGRLNQLWRYPDQIIQPWQFSEPYHKKTCLWLKGLPPLMSTVLHMKTDRWVNSGSFTRVSRQRRSGGVSNARERARTFQGIANAMADQWGAS
jgi:hypothetical protein